MAAAARPFMVPVTCSLTFGEDFGVVVVGGGYYDCLGAGDGFFALLLRFVYCLFKFQLAIKLASVFVYFHVERGWRALS